MICEFCDKKEFEGRTLFEDDLVRAFLTKMPIVPGHTLVIPKRHFANFADMTDQELQATRNAVQKLHKAMVTLYGAHGFNSAFNEGQKAGQSVPHFHMHVIPRTSGDAGIVEYEPRQFLYRPGSRATTEREELLQAAEELRAAL